MIPPIASRTLLISIHALRKESDLQSRRTRCTSVLVFQSTLSVRRATQSYERFPPELFISIHALRKESDTVVRTFSA